MAKLPFVVQPRLKPIIERIGSDESGIIEIERKGYLTSGEKSFVQQVQQQDDGTLQLVSLSRQIAKEKDISLDKAYNIVIEIITGQSKSKVAKEIESEFAEKIQSTLNSLASARLRDDMVQAACLLIHRVNGDFSINDIMEIHPDLVQELANLYREEEAKSIERLVADQKEKDKNEVNVDEIEKKPEEKVEQ